MPWVRGASIAIAPTSTGGGSVPRSRASSRGISLRRMIQGSISTAASRIRPRKAGTAPGGREAIAWTCISWLPTLSVRVIGTPSRSTLSISTTRTAPRQRAEHPAAAAEDRGAADDHGGDDDQLGAQAVLRGDALVLGHVHQPGERGAQRRQDEAADAHELRVDAGIFGRQRVAADGVGLVAPAGAGEHDRRRRIATSTKTRIWLLKPSALLSPSAKKANSRALTS